MFSLPTALCLPASDIEVLIQGRTVAALPKMFLRSGQRFALYPLDTSANLLSLEQYYRADFLPSAQTAIKQVNSETVSIKAWAKCELCQILDKTKPLDVLSQLTIWKPEAFEAIIQKQQNIFLAYLRVYHLPQPYQVPANSNIQDKIGKFVSLSNISGSEAKSVLSDRIFIQRKSQLEKLEPPLNPEWEELQSALAQLAMSNPAAQQLENDIKIFLGWSGELLTQSSNTELTWIKTIAALGNRSIEQDEGKNNYQAGTDFENIARRSLDFLGFKVEDAYKGGAGGLDLFCSQPYSLVCECKAGKSIPDRAVEELDRLGKRHLKENYLQAMRLIIGPGKPTKNLKESAEISKISIINVMTLQKLVEFKAKYPGAINLVELQHYLKPGQIDYKIDEYIEKVEREIKLRSQIIKTVKELSEQDNESSQATPQCFTVTEIRAHYNAKHNPKHTDETVREFVLELSSPLTGYLGRERGSDWKSDRFYYLRDLPL
ncbi:DUF1802 domain-containing protein [Nostoc sp. 106C]|nr:DUF1802 domain-containing protein [Nostoc sp. 106C]